MPEFASAGWLWLLLAVPLVVLARLRGGVAESRIKRVVGGVFRALALATLIIALAGPLSGRKSRHTDVVFVLDVSSSVGEGALQRALAFVNEAFAARHPDARMGLVVFGADAAVESVLKRATLPVTEITSDIVRSGSNIERAIQVAVGSFPSAEHRRIVLLSDGQENLGAARSAAAVARSVGVEIVSVPLEQPPLRNEVRVQGIDAPSRVRAHEPFQVQMTLHSAGPARGHLMVLRNGVMIEDRQVDLTPGANVFALTEQVAVGGLYEYEVVLNSDQDREQANNRYQSFVQVRGPPRVLHAVGRTADAHHVTQALEAQGLEVEEVPASALPASMHGLAEYALVILNDVSGFDLSLGKMELLEDYVRDAGGGVIKIGGERSYAAGGYFATPVERLLPVTMDVKTEVKIPSVAVIFVLDRSGSMGSRSHGEEKLAIAKNAALASIEVLNRLDRVGVLAFDSAAEWVVPPTEVGLRRPITERLRGLSTGGGTDLFQAVSEAYRVMRQERAKVKHLIVLSDGLTEGHPNFDALGERIASDGITVSTIAMGADADRALMQRLAVMGNGRFHFTSDPRNIPRIFISETMVVARDLVVERTVQPVLQYPGEMLKGLDAEAIPKLDGYQRTFPKPAAQVLLRAPGDDPLLVSWRYGLGKSVAFMSDMSARWGHRWVVWPQFSRALAQMARWTMRPSGHESMLAEFSWKGDRGEVLVDVLDRDDRFVNGLDMRGVITDPRRSAHEVSLRQIAPGRYRGEFPTAVPGRYFASLSAQGDSGTVGPRTFGFAVPYSPEYLDLGVDRELLEAVATQTGGELLALSGDSLARITARKPQAVNQQQRVWWPLLAAALGIVLLELIVRKLTAPEAWRARRRAERDGEQESEPDYDALRARIEQVRARHLAALRDGSVVALDDPAARARLYLAQRRPAR